MEFLMTYGWAILIMLVVIAVLFYLGVLNPRGVAPNSLTFPPGFSAYDYHLDENAHLFLDLGHTQGETITILSVLCAPQAGGDTPTGSAPYTAEIPNGEHRVVSNGGITCSGASGTFYKGKITIYYTKKDAPTFTHKIVGDLSHRLEPDSG